MSMKKLAAHILVILIVFSLAGCGRLEDAETVYSTTPSETPASSTSANNNSYNENSESIDNSSLDITDDISETLSPEPDESTVPDDVTSIEWQTFSMEETDNEGYQIKTTIKIGSWIKSTDKDLVDATWNEISVGAELPSRNSFRIYDTYTDKIVSSGVMHYASDEIIYAFGTIKVENITPGFDFTENNTYNSKLRLHFRSGEKRNSMWGTHNNLGKMLILYSNATKLYGVSNVGSDEYGVFRDQTLPSFLMSNNKWGPVSFVIAMPEQFNPKNPNGDPALDECYFVFGENTFTIEKTY